MFPLDAQDAWQLAGIVVLKAQLSSLLVQVRRVFGMAGVVSQKEEHIKVLYNLAWEDGTWFCRAYRVDSCDVHDLEPVAT